MSAEGIEGEETEEWGVRKENEEKRTGWGGGTVEPEQSQARAMWEGIRGGRVRKGGRALRWGQENKWFPQSWRLWLESLS